MNERVIKLIVFSIFVLAANIGYGEDLKSSLADQITKEAASVGRDDPFGGALGGVIPEAKPDVSSNNAEPVSPKQPLFVQTVVLKFLKASNLKSALDKMISVHGGIAVDEGTNSLIICDTNESLTSILCEVKKADKTPSQVMIEVVIVDVQLSNDTEIGVDWDLLSTKNYNIGYRQSMVSTNRLISTPENDDTIGNMTAFMTQVGPGGGLGGELSIVSSTVRNVVHLIQEKRNVDILASPRVMVVSGQEAEIKTVEEIPYRETTQTSGGGELASTQFKEVGITLAVKATVADDGKILLVIKPKQSVSAGTSGISGVPIIDTREASTTLLMNDGQVAVMGGLRRQETKIIKSQIPLLGDLPLVGLIFSTNQKVVDNSELLVLLSPHIYKDDPVPADVMARYDKTRNQPLLKLPVEPEPWPFGKDKKQPAK